MTLQSTGLFASGGEVGADLAAVNWTRTPLGPPSEWPQSLSSAVRILLSSRFAMWMAWGPELTFFCNDTYRRDTLGTKYPWALGRPASEVWSEIWADIGPRIEHVMATGEATWDEALQLFLERAGYREESYHTFSYSPLSDDEGRVSGMLCVVSEDTERVVGARRMAIVRDLGAHVTALRSEQAVLDATVAQIAANPEELPFALVYRLEEQEDIATLVAVAGIERAHPAAVPSLDPDDADSPWPVHGLLAGDTVVVDDLAARFQDLPTGAWPDPPESAVVLPFRQQGQDRPQGFLIAATNRYRPLNTDYRGFLELMANQVGSALSTARAYQQERERSERLVELDRAKTAFFTNVSHEFRTPLTLLLGPAEDALADTAHPLGEVQRERAEIVARNGERLLKMVNTLLDFSRLESGTLGAAFEPVDLPAYTTELARSFLPAVERVGLTLTLDCPPIAQPVYVDREMWAKIVLNLLSNALKFTFEGGITVALHAAGDEVHLQVIDTGTGIPEDRQAGLFERFTRVPGARSRSHEGSGIGLALVAELSAAHGGRVEVESAPERGSTFTVRLPLGRAHLPPEQLVTAPAGGSYAGTPERTTRGFLAEALRWLGGRERSGRTGAAAGASESAGPNGVARPTVLVADDNADMRDYVARLLSAEHEVIVVENGRQALETARLRAPDLVLSDVMMPELDGFGLLAALRADPLTATIPVVLLSARAGEEATVEGLDAGADDYLVKPFSARELLARVRANLELERVRRTRRELERSRALLDQAQRIARVGSWEIDLQSGVITASPEFLRQVQVSPDELATGSLGELINRQIHPDDRERVEGLLRGAIEQGTSVDYDVRLVLPDGQTRTFRTLGELDHDDEGTPVRLRGSNQDVTEQRAAEQALATAAAAAEAALREHRIADELQRSLLPAPDVAAEGLTIAAYYRAGVEGTQVGGDWYDVIELGAGRTALVLGDVMGRGVRAAAVMGQLRSAVRAYARLDLPPADVLEHLDGVVRDIGDDQIVTCVYAVHDPHDHVLTYANAGHLPPLVRTPEGEVIRLDDAEGAPLGTAAGRPPEHAVQLAPGVVLALYTDGLVEHRDSDIDTGIDGLATLFAATERQLRPSTPHELVAGLLPDGADDDVAVLMVQVEPAPAGPTATFAVPDDVTSVARTRRSASALLAGWAVPRDVQDDALLLVSELVTNAILHGRAPVELRLRRSARALVIEVLDGANAVPRLMHPSTEEEHGRGVQLVARLASRWAIRPTGRGKSVWCVFDLPD